MDIEEENKILDWNEDEANYIKLSSKFKKR